MNEQTVRETLEKQLQLLSERSNETNDLDGLTKLTDVMCDVARVLLDP